MTPALFLALTLRIPAYGDAHGRVFVRVGPRWVAACRAAGVEPWADGMSTRDGLPRRLLFTSSEAWSSTYGYMLPLPQLPGRQGPSRPPSPARDPKAFPDLTDPATKGAALGILRAAWDEPTLHVMPICDGDWVVERVRDDGVAEWLRACGQWGAGTPARGATEAEALVAAAEALAARGGGQ